MFKISASSEYALILAKFLWENPGIHTIESLADRMDIPLPMLRKVASRLERGGIIRSKKGRAGGVFASEKAPSVKEVLVAAGENLSIAVCSGKECASSDRCSIAPVIKNLQRGFESILSITRL